jgi:hypothetical protein
MSTTIKNLDAVAGRNLNAASDSSADVTVRLSFPWWLHPGWAAGVFVAILPIASASQIQDAFQLWDVPRYIDFPLAVVGVLSGLAFICAAVFAGGFGHSSAVSVTLTAGVVRRLHHLALVMFALALFGYVAWFGLSFMRGATLADFMKVLSFEDGAVGGLKDISPPVAGITTFTQIGVVAAAIMMFLRRSNSGTYSKYLAVLVCLALFRSFFYGERLALIEVVLPLIIITFVVDVPVGRRKRWLPGYVRLPKALAPVLMLPALWALFALFEYSRSWLYYREVVNTSFIEYVSTRLLGYYTTTVNNGALYHQILSSQHHDPYFSFAFLWDAPGIGWLLGSPEIMGSNPRTWWSSTLANLANPEFNNEGTFLITDADLGTPLSMAYWVVLGLAIGYTYNRARSGDLRFLIAYSVLFIGLLEISRINYWTQGRFIPIFIGIIVVILSVGRPAARKV